MAERVEVATVAESALRKRDVERSPLRIKHLDDRATVIIGRVRVDGEAAAEEVAREGGRRTSARLVALRCVDETQAILRAI